MALTCENVEFAFTPGRRVLAGISARFAPGRLTAVLGPNGSGKSTLLRVLLGVVRPDQGRAALDGVDTGTLRGAARASAMAYIGQRAEGWTPFRVRDVVAMGRTALPSDADTVRAAMTAAEVEALADEPLSTLSAGQQQRVALARVLAQVRGRRAPRQTGSRCVLADEPISAMDPAHGRRTMALLRDVAAEGVAVVVVLHDFTLAARDADDAIVLSTGGGLAAVGPAAAVLRPEVLAPVFGTRFERVESAEGGPVVFAVGSLPQGSGAAGG